MYGQPAASQPASRPGPYRSSCSSMLMHACNAAMRATASSWLQPCMYTALASAPSEALSYMYYMCYMAVLAPTKYTAISLSLSRSGLAGWLLLRAAGWLAFSPSFICMECVHRSQSGRVQPCTTWTDSGTAMYRYSLRLARSDHSTCPGDKKFSGR